MSNQASKSFLSLWSIKKEFRTKVFLLSSTFLFMSACLVLWKPMKMSLFAKLVGPTAIPYAKIYGLALLIPLILLYSKLVDWLRRHHLLYCFTLAHAVGGIIFSILLAHPIYGIANTNTSSARLIGWAYYFFMESFDAFFSTVFWSFADSVNNPKDARNYFGYFVSGSKIGGIISAGTLYMLLKYSTAQGQIALIPKTMFIGSLMLIAAATCVFFLVRLVPENKMHGYEQVYQLEKNQEHPKKKRTSILQGFKSSFAGLFIMIKNPYVLGIFSLVVFYEVIIVIFDYIVILQAHQTHKTIGSLTAYYALYYLLMNVIGLIIALFGTTPLLRVLGIRLSLFIFPGICLCLLFVSFLFPSAWVLFATLVGLRAFNYALNHPTREFLYIPTTKDIKFKAKTWTDAFGSRIAKTSGSMFNLAIHGLTPAAAFISSITLSLGLTSLWFIIIYFLGKTLQKAIDNKQIIGEKKQTTRTT